MSTQPKEEKNGYNKKKTEAENVMVTALKHAEAKLRLIGATYLLLQFNEHKGKT